MGFFDRPAAGLAWLGRHGTNAVAISILLGIALPPLGALVRPFFPETVFLLLCLAFLRVDPGALRAQLARPWLLIAAAVWIMLIAPVLVGLGLNALDLFDRSPGLLLALGLRLVLMLTGAAGAAIAIRAVAGKPWVARQAERIDGLNVVVLFLFAVALMGDVAENTIAHPLFVLGLLGLSTALTFGLSGLTLLIFARAGLRSALPLAHSAGSRNTGLMLAAAAGAVPELVWLYVALLQIPIYALPLIIKPLLR